MPNFDIGYTWWEICHQVKHIANLTSKNMLKENQSTNQKHKLRYANEPILENFSLNASNLDWESRASFSALLKASRKSDLT